MLYVHKDLNFINKYTEKYLRQMEETIFKNVTIMHHYLHSKRKLPTQKWLNPEKEILIEKGPKFAVFLK